MRQSAWSDGFTDIKFDDETNEPIRFRGHPGTNHSGLLLQWRPWSVAYHKTGSIPQWTHSLWRIHKLVQIQSIPTSGKEEPNYVRKVIIEKALRRLECPLTCRTTSQIFENKKDQSPKSITLGKRRCRQGTTKRGPFHRGRWERHFHWLLHQMNRRSKHYIRA